MNSKDFYILKTLYQKYGFEKVQGILEHINNITEIKKKIINLMKGAFCICQLD